MRPRQQDKGARSDKNGKRGAERRSKKFKSAPESYARDETLFRLKTRDVLVRGASGVSVLINLILLAV
jgi:hypothetical protein